MQPWRSIFKVAAKSVIVMLTIALGAAICAEPVFAQEVSQPAALRVDELTTPIGIDNPLPRFSWQLRDSRQNAQQTAYRIRIAARPEMLAGDKANVWDSGRIESSHSVAVPYGGPALAPFTRYFWNVQVWDQAGKAAPVSEASWWETGLMDGASWRHAKWVGYETPEETAVRHAEAVWIASPDAQTLAKEQEKEKRFAYRTKVTLTKPVQCAVLYVTGQDTVSAWVDGKQELKAKPLPLWKQMPWKKFVRVEIVSKLAPGEHTLAIEPVHYVENSGNVAEDEKPPMIAVLVVAYADGSWAAFASGTAWKTAIHPAAGWQQNGFDDSGWKYAVTWRQGKQTADDALGKPWIPDSVKALRREFDVTSPVKSARLYATALGAYEIFMNGRRVGDQLLAPGWTDYRQKVVYQTYDMTALVKAGKNALGALLAPGWYAGSLEWSQRPNDYGVAPPALRAELRIEHVNGSVEWITTDANWQANRSSILHSEIYDGETQDARLLAPGWNTAGFEAVGWKPAMAIDTAPVRIEAQDFPPIRVEKTLGAVKVTEPKPGVWVYDFGQNLAGVERVRVQGKAGTDVRLRFAEVLNDDGTLYTDNLRTAKVTDRFILSGKGVEEFVPQFTFHGFRYAELTGLPTAPARDAVLALVFHTDAPFTAKLATGSAMVNKLWNNILWGQRSNFMSVPTDCPQRDERLGWTADAQVFWSAASFNANLAAFSRKYAGDMRETQVETPYFGAYAPGTAAPNVGWGAGWSDAGVIIPWTSWIQSGDTRILTENWDAMEKYLNAIEKANPDGLWEQQSGIPFGDWLAPEGPTVNALIATAYWAYDATLMRQMAHALGKQDAEEHYAKLFVHIREAFQRAYMHGNGFISGADRKAASNRLAVEEDTQTGYVLALHMHLVPEELRAAAAAKLAAKIKANHNLLGTGFLGTPYLLSVLAENGQAALAYTLLLNTEYPSWGYLVEHGATTVWERWNGDQMRDDPAMNSYNHYAYGAVADWIYRYAAGVDTTPLDAGFHTVVLHPVFNRRMGSIDLRYQSPYGEIHSRWSVEGNTTHWLVTIPPNSKGWLRLTTGEAKSYMLAGKPLADSPLAKPVTLEEQPGYEIPAGTYAFEVTGGTFN